MGVVAGGAITHGVFQARGSINKALEQGPEYVVRGMRVRSARKILSYLALFRNVLILAVSCPYPKNNVLLFPAPARLEPGRRRGIRCRERLGGLLRYYSRAA